MGKLSALAAGERPAAAEGRKQDQQCSLHITRPQRGLRSKSQQARLWRAWQTVLINGQTVSGPRSGPPAAGGTPHRKSLLRKDLQKPGSYGLGHKIQKVAHPLDTVFRPGWGCWTLGSNFGRYMVSAVWPCYLRLQCTHLVIRRDAWIRAFLSISR